MSSRLAHAQVLVEDDAHGRIAIAQIMREIIAELESFPRPEIETRSSVIQLARRQ